MLNIPYNPHGPPALRLLALDSLAVSTPQPSPPVNPPPPSGNHLRDPPQGPTLRDQGPTLRDQGTTLKDQGQPLTTQGQSLTTQGQSLLPMDQPQPQESQGI